MSGKSSCSPKTKSAFVGGLQALGYTVEQQGEITATLLGVVLAQAEEIQSLTERLQKVEKRMPSSFRAG